MNICLVSREYPTDDHSGGIGTYTEKTARGLAQLGQTVSVITETAGAASTRMEEGVLVVRLAPPTGGRLRTIRRAYAVAQAIKRLPHPPDLIQASEYRAEAIFLAAQLRRRARLVTRLATPTFMVQGLNRGSGAGRVRSGAYYDPLERWQTRRSDGIIAITNALAEVVCNRWAIPRERVRTIPNSVDFDKRFGAQPASLPEALIGRDYLLYFGRLEERKGVHILAEALPRVLERYPQLHAAFAGENVLTYRGETLQACVERYNARFGDRLHFFPRLPHRQLYPLVKGALVAVLPSLWEGLGNVSLEALDAGTPVIATLGCGFGEVVEDGKSGVLVEPGNVAALQGALLAVLSDRDRVAQMRGAARDRAEHFHPDRILHHLLAYYRSLMGGAASRAAVNAPDAA